MTYEIINSSSNGNLIIINEFLALDMGVPYIRVKPYLDKIKIIFISHSHT